MIRIRVSKILESEPNNLIWIHNTDLKYNRTCNKSFFLTITFLSGSPSACMLCIPICISKTTAVSRYIPTTTTTTTAFQILVSVFGGLAVVLLLILFLFCCTSFFKRKRPVHESEENGPDAFQEAEGQAGPQEAQGSSQHSAEFQPMIEQNGSRQ